MFNPTLADISSHAAYDFDFLRIGSAVRFDGVNKLISAIRQNICIADPWPADVVIINEVLTHMHFEKCTTVSEVVIAANGIAGRLEKAWADQQYDEELARFCLTLSKVAAARLCGHGQSMLLDCQIIRGDTNEQSAEVSKQN